MSDYYVFDKRELSAKDRQTLDKLEKLMAIRRHNKGLSPLITQVLDITPEVSQNDDSLTRRSLR